MVRSSGQAQRVRDAVEELVGVRPVDIAAFEDAVPGDAGAGEAGDVLLAELAFAAGADEFGERSGIEAGTPASDEGPQLCGALVGTSLSAVVSCHM